MATKTVTTEWKKVRLDECFNIQQGKQVSKKNRLGENQYPFLRTANVFWGRLDLHELDQMNFSAEEEKKFALKKGDLLVCEGGDIGRTAMWNEEIERCYYQNHLHRLRKVNDEIDENFILFYLKYAFVYAKLYAGRANITTIPNLSKSRLSELEILLPSISDQRSIARKLTIIQEAIVAQEKLIAKLKDLKTSMMQHLFTHGTKGEKTKMTEFGEMPESWEIMKFSDFSVDQIYIKNGFPCGSWNEDGIGLLQLRPFNISEDGKIILKQRKYIETDKKIDDYVLRSEDIVFNNTNSEDLVGKTSWWNSDEHAVLSNHMTIIRILDKNIFNYVFLANFLHNLWEQREFKKLCRRHVNQASISIERLSSIGIPTPTITEQRKIGLLFISIDRKLDMAQEKLSNYQNLFKTLLHELMSGEKRINLK